MALNEACQLWIEQEIEEGLREGKKPYSIGKEISAAIEKLFEARIPAGTVEKRAQRIQDKCLEKAGRPTKLQQKQNKTDGQRGGDEVEAIGKALSAESGGT